MKISNLIGQELGRRKGVKIAMPCETLAQENMISEHIQWLPGATLQRYADRGKGSPLVFNGRGELGYSLDGGVNTNELAKGKPPKDMSCRASGI
jgi:hypothetical protein